MDTNKNSYTIIYATVLVIFVAALLAFVSSSLKDKQQKNMDVEKQLSLLEAVGLAKDVASAPDKNSYAEGEFSQYIKKGLVVNAKGEVVSESENSTATPDAIIKGEAFKIDLKAQFDLMKVVATAPADQKEALGADLKLPVFIAELPSGESIYVFSCYGAGLWGPIWGYVALKGDLNTIYGAVFSHKGETPGLGAEIATPKFYDQFKDKVIYTGGDLTSIIVAKGAAPAGSTNMVDGISGGTITSKALEGTIKSWLEFYVPYLDKMRSGSAIGSTNVIK